MASVAIPTARPTVPNPKPRFRWGVGATRDPDTGALLGCGDAGAGPLTTRRPSANGKVLGPYLELKDESIIGSLGANPDNSLQWDPASIDPSSNAPKVFFPGDAGYDRNAPKVIVDAWGTPIRYYRRAYPQGNLAGSFRATHTPLAGISGSSQSWQYTPTLSEFIALRPFEIEPSQATDYIFQPGGQGVSWGDFSEGGNNIKGDPTTTTSLQAGEFAFLSAGPDRRIFNWHRADYLDRGGNDGQTFLGWLGHHPGRANDSSWFADGRGGYCHADGWWQAGRDRRGEQGQHTGDLAMMNRRQRLGFTLIELTVTIVIILILATISLSIGNRVLRKGEVDETVSAMKIGSAALHEFSQSRGRPLQHGSSSGRLALSARRHVRCIHLEVGHHHSRRHAQCGWCRFAPGLSGEDSP